MSSKSQHVCTPVTLTTTANTKVGGAKARFAVTAAGNVLCRYVNDVDVTLHFPAAGVYFEEGPFTEMWLPAAGAATLSPASVVNIYS